MRIMSNKEISQSAIERNRAWIKGVCTALNELRDEKICQYTMKSAGKECAEQILEKTISHFGKEPKSVYELIEAINKRRREVLNASTFWTIDGNQAHFILKQCGCDLVEEGLAEPNPTFCLCSAGMFENVFRPFHHGGVRAEIKKAIGMHDDYCEFIIHFE